VLVPEAKWMLISATRGDNLAELRQMLIDVLPEGPALFPEDELTQTHLRDLCAELIREAALTSLEQEVPHGIAIEIELFDETSKPGLVRVSSVLYVEREAHKGIVIGAGGSKLKEIGVNARQQMETLLQQKVFLEVHVKVRRNWREKENEVRRMGYRKQE
jgi:GTP-binding protein Era